ncbi:MULTISPECIES: Fe-S oxidoreductase [Leucobacter]|uniref:Fe-S oxidoreductase n=1 Tax=Leucobacter manosquensis TaxID=2810611 RepID=A0ABS5M2T0_9MICO|nr:MULTISPECIES: Fe-S oxidoreductase [Leucobacter]MBS3181271.1 Fe-S oxidoreductase [Leucobacter manosquensis]
MQLGARWQRGTPPHRSVPEALHAAIAEQENGHPEADSWTLTWLEGRPRCELDDLVFVALDVVGRVRTGPVSGSGEPGLAEERLAHSADDDADDDDWLS